MPTPSAVSRISPIAVAEDDVEHRRVSSMRSGFVRQLLEVNVEGVER
jgi:hypothetical protein